MVFVTETAMYSSVSVLFCGRTAFPRMVDNMAPKSKNQSAPGERAIRCGKTAIQFGGSQAELSEQLRGLAREISAGLSCLEPSQGKELLGDFISELFLCAANEDIRRVRRQKQAEGIAKAKANGVRFGPEAKPLPDNFSECYDAWQSGEMTATKAAENCGLSRKTFYRMVARIRSSEEYAV